MKYSIGDNIILKRTGEEGIITDFIGKDMLEVEVNNIRFPAYIDEVDHPYLKWFTEKKKPDKKNSLPEQLPIEKSKNREQKLPKGIHLSFLPVFKSDDLEDIVTHVKVYLINEMSVPINFRYDLRIPHESHFRHEGNLHAFGNIYLHTIDYEIMSNQPRFHWELSDSSHPEFKIETGVLKIKPSKLFEHISQLLLKNEPSFNYKLVDDFVEKPKPEKPEPFLPKPIAPTIFSTGKKKLNLQDLPKHELDLHIEQLVPNPNLLSNVEKLDIQLRTLDKYLHLALIHHQERMIIIHGLGKGALKDAVHKMLQAMPEIKHFRNEWMGKYGHGATEVIFNK